MNENAKIILKTDKLTRYFGSLKAVDEVSFELPTGETRAIIGPNGAGKTTLLDLIVGRTPQTSGSVYLDGVDISNEKAFKIARMGMCKTFQISKLFSGLTVFENVKTACIQLKGQAFNILPKGEGYLRDEVMQALEYVDITHTIDEIAEELSYGDQKRLEIAITLAMHPKLLLLDESTAGVARQEGYTIMDMVQKLAADLHMTTLFIEHDMDIVFNYSDKISVMRLDAMIATDTPEEIRKNEFVQEAYLGGDGE